MDDETYRHHARIDTLNTSHCSASGVAMSKQSWAQPGVKVVFCAAHGRGYGGANTIDKVYKNGNFILLSQPSSSNISIPPQQYTPYNDGHAYKAGEGRWITHTILRMMTPEIEAEIKLQKKARENREIIEAEIKRLTDIATAAGRYIASAMNIAQAEADGIIARRSVAEEKVIP